jgi:hypothetical protein
VGPVCPGNIKSYLFSNTIILPIEACIDKPSFNLSGDIFALGCDKLITATKKSFIGSI